MREQSKLPRIYVQICFGEKVKRGSTEYLVAGKREEKSEKKTKIKPVIPRWSVLKQSLLMGAEFSYF